VLIYLIEQRGRLVTKEELMESIWKDTAVTDDALVQQLPCVECFEMGIQRVERLRKNVRELELRNDHSLQPSRKVAAAEGFNISVKPGLFFRRQMKPSST